MKKIFLTALMAIGVNFASAQNLEFGVKAGAVFNADSGETVWNNAGNIFKSKGEGRTGFQAGVLMRANLAGIYVQPELLYTQFENEYETQGINYTVGKKRIDIPVAVGKKFLGLSHVQAGPTFSYYFEDDISFNQLTNAKQDQFNVGMHIGVGAEVSKFLFDLRYEFGFGKVSSEWIHDNSNYKTEYAPKLLNLSVAYLF
ncbi:outer membrane beta-barrel protein [Vaginella massiliensis]|uniref:outer membrane beta-barrel protein n=1 Tax=Vaginella massiliensis TaxID=1816680 RepID=UPI000838D176|nr:outer membrane beta-barrel protein [Vaginella massiliensis]